MKGAFLITQLEPMLLDVNIVSSKQASEGHGCHPLFPMKDTVEIAGINKAAGVAISFSIRP